MKTFTLMMGLIILSFGIAFGEQADDGYIGPNLLRGNPELTIYQESDAGIPLFVSGRLGQNAAKGSELATTISFFQNNQAAYRMTDPAEELHLVRIDNDNLDMKHVRLQQRYQGLRVISGDLISHFTAEGDLETVNGYYHPGIELDVTPSQTAETAMQVATDDLKSFFGSANPQEPELVVFPHEGFNYLCWRMFLLSDSPPGRWEYFIDAKTGDVVFKANRIMEADVWGTGVGVMGDTRSALDIWYEGGTYYMIDYTRQLNNNVHGHKGYMPDGNYIRTNIAGSSLPGSVATDADNVWDDPNVQSPAVDGHYYTGIIYDWMVSHLDRNGYDDNGASMLTIVNYSGDGDNNAYWDGSRIVIWSWGTGWRSLAACPDVIAHEWGHAVTEYTSNLAYQLESGALNEAYSDIQGAAFEWMNDSLDTPDWDMGENGRLTGVGFRSMSDPHSAGDPDYYGTSDPYWVDVEGCSPSYYNDYCGVHTNCGVGNKWFYLLSDGGEHHGITVTGIEVENAMLIAYRANAYYWTSSSDYENGALGTISAANDLDPTGAWALQAANAWNAVGVNTPGPSLTFDYPDGVPSLLAPNQAETFAIDISGILGGSPEPGSGLLHYAVDGGSYTGIALTELGGSQYEATLPAIGCNSIISFYVSVDEQSGTTYYDPDPTQPNSAIAATETDEVFADNFELNLGWTVSGSVLDGAWNRGIPAGGGERGDPPTDYDGSGQCYLTDNVYGNSDVDDGTTYLTSPTFDATNGTCRISYARWYSNDFGAAPNTDSMLVHISNNNGTSWTVLEVVGPIDQASGGWYEPSFWVADYVTPTSQMKVRFAAADLGDGSVVEAGVDAFTVTVYRCSEFIPQILTSDIPDWTAGIPISQQLEATGGTGALTWSDKFGDLSGTGLTLSSTGLLSGTVINPQTVTFTAVATDEALETDEQAYSFIINAPVTVLTTSLPDWTAGQYYVYPLEATGGTGELVWSDKFSELTGTGLSLATDGTIAGVPTDPGLISFTAGVSDQVGDLEDAPLTITINVPVEITTGSLADGVAEEAYSVQLEYSGGTAPVVWSDKFNDLDGMGLTLTSEGLLSGTVMAEGEITFTARAVDHAGSADEQAYSLVINPDFVCGDADGDELINLLDVLYIIDYLYGVPQGPAPDPLHSADVNADDGINLLDVLYIIDYLYGTPQGPEPNCP
ncbi:MAG: M4 family metallopeptidase [candidate division Zixibacteria bacterium]|nr:M4 family metallopeptidase [candidate division Zixibacteria bacterium]